MTTMQTAPIFIRSVPPGTRWPSGRSLDTAVIAISAAEVKAISGCPMKTGDEEGMGSWRAIGFQLSTGEHMELIEYGNSSGDGFVLRVDADQPLQRSFERFLHAFGLAEDAMLWRSPLCSPILNL